MTAHRNSPLIVAMSEKLYAKAWKLGLQISHDQARDLALAANAGRDEIFAEVYKRPPSYPTDRKDNE